MKLSEWVEGSIALPAWHQFSLAGLGLALEMSGATFFEIPKTVFT